MICERLQIVHSVLAGCFALNNDREFVNKHLYSTHRAPHKSMVMTEWLHILISSHDVHWPTAHSVYRRGILMESLGGRQGVGRRHSLRSRRHCWDLGLRKHVCMRSHRNRRIEQLRSSGWKKHLVVVASHVRLRHHHLLRRSHHWTHHNGLLRDCSRAARSAFFSHRNDLKQIVKENKKKKKKEFDYLGLISRTAEETSHWRME